MKSQFFNLTILIILGLSVLEVLQSSGEQNSAPSLPEEALTIYQHHKIYHRHRGELAKLPGVVSVGLAGKAILVTTYLPEWVPSSIGGLAVKTEAPRESFVLGGMVTEIELESMLEKRRAQVRAKWSLDWRSPML